MDVYDIDANTWTRTPSLRDSGVVPGFRSGGFDVWGVSLTADAARRRLFVMGAESNRQLYVFDVATQTWTVGPTAPYDGGWGASIEYVAASDRVYQIDGRAAAGTPQGTAALAMSVITGPSSITTCANQAADFAVTAGEGGPYTYRWQIEATSGVWQTLGHDPFPLPCGGGGFAYSLQPFSIQTAIVVHPCPGVRTYNVRAVLTNSCGSFTSDTATLTVCACLACPADFNQDGGIDGNDVEAFFITWEAGECDADVNGDGGINGGDVETFFVAWEAGGC